jgi:NitT/TauT family transport system substrate-binding protein
VSKGHTLKQLRTLAVSALAVLALPLAACGSEASTDTSSPSGAAEDLGTLKVGLSVPVMAFAPFFWAEAQDTWGDLGLDVEIIEFKAPADGVQAFVGGAVDVSSAGLNGAVNLINEGHDVKVFWAGMNAADFAWYGKPEYRTLEDAKGGTFGVSSHGALDNLVLDAIASGRGLTPGEDLKYQQVGATANGIAALRAGTLDVALVSPPTKYQIAEEGFTELATQAEELAPEWPKEVVYAKAETITAKEDQLVALADGLADAITWARDNADEASKVLADRFKVEQKYGAAAYEELMPTFYEDGRLPSDAGMEAFWKAMVSAEAADVDAPWELDKWWTDEIRDARG